VRVGIDFGTTRTVVSAVDRGNYPILPFEDPYTAVAEWSPSLIAVKGDQHVYGWQAWACQQYPDWTIVRSLKRVLQDAGPYTILQLGDSAVPVSQVLQEMASALRAALPNQRLEVVLGVPANANSNQRFLTVEAFRAAGCDVIGLLNEPSAACIEYGHRTKATGVILVYDLGGGTFDASLVRIGERTHEVLASEGISALGGDDFDEVLAELVVGEQERAELSQSEQFRLLEECRLKKESLHPHMRQISLDLDNVREGWGSRTVAATDYYERCRPLVEATLKVVEDLLVKNEISDLEAVYVTGGGSQLPLVNRMVKDRYGKRFRRSLYARSATAIGLAIQADLQAGYVLSDKFSRYFGVWRESDSGRKIAFDSLFTKGTVLPRPGEQPLEIRRRYTPVHNIGHLRYIECTYLVADGQPGGDVTVWDEIRFPFDPALQNSENRPVEHSQAALSQLIEEKYSSDASGVVTVTITNLTASYSRQFRLGRWASTDVTPSRPRVRHRAYKPASPRIEPGHQ